MRARACRKRHRRPGSMPLLCKVRAPAPRAARTMRIVESRARAAVIEWVLDDALHARAIRAECSADKHRGGRAYSQRASTRGAAVQIEPDHVTLSATMSLPPIADVRKPAAPRGGMHRCAPAIDRPAALGDVDEMDRRAVARGMDAVLEPAPVGFVNNASGEALRCLASARPRRAGTDAHHVGELRPNVLPISSRHRPPEKNRRPSVGAECSATRCPARACASVMRSNTWWNSISPGERSFSREV